MKHAACHPRTGGCAVTSAPRLFCRALLCAAICANPVHDAARAEAAGSDSVATESSIASDSSEVTSAQVDDAQRRLAGDSISAEAPRALPPGFEATGLPIELHRWIDSERLTYSAQLGVTMVLLGLIPAFLLMTTSYIRISIVLSLVRQAFGAQLLPMQVTSALAILCTGLVMWPTWQSVHERAIVPWMQGAESTNLIALWDDGIEPIREFMIRQIHANFNGEDVHVFLQQMAVPEDYPSSWDQVPLRALLPAFVLSELKTAFIIGFRIYLPFLVIDLVVATVTTSMGMFMLPPNMVSLPLKLLLFVMVDGWRLIVEMLLTSFT